MPIEKITRKETKIAYQPVPYDTDVVSYQTSDGHEFYSEVTAVHHEQWLALNTFLTTMKKLIDDEGNNWYCLMSQEQHKQLIPLLSAVDEPVDWGVHMTYPRLVRWWTEDDGDHGTSEHTAFITREFIEKVQAAMYPGV